MGRCGGASLPFRAVGRLRERVEDVGVDEIGRRYLAALRAPGRRNQWIVDAVWFGGTGEEVLPVELRWELVMAALDACPDDDGELWCLGDGPFDHLAAEPGMVERIHAEREGNPKLRRLFEAMRRKLPEEGVEDGWWFE